MGIESPGCAYAQAAPETARPEYRMGEVVVTATRDAQEVRKVPANVTVITADDIQKSGATSVPEVLTGLVGINVTSYSGNASQSIVDMRGFGTEAGYLRNVVMLDGRRLNRPDLAGVNWLEIPLSEIERIEVVRGANSVLYGDSAIAGSINIITKRGEGKPKGDATFIGGSYNTYNGRAGVRGSADKVYYALNGEVLTSSGYRDRSKFTTESAGGSVGYNPTDALDVSLGITANKTDNQFPGALTQAQYNANRKQAQNPDDDASASFFDANLLVKTILGSFGRLDANLIYGRREVTSNYASFASFTKIDIDTVGATPRYILDKKLFGFDNKLTVGFDFYQRQARQGHLREPLAGNEDLRGGAQEADDGAVCPRRVQHPEGPHPGPRREDGAGRCKRQRNKPRDGCQCLRRRESSQGDRLGGLAHVPLRGEVEGLGKVRHDLPLPLPGPAGILLRLSLRQLPDGSGEGDGQELRSGHAGQPA